METTFLIGLCIRATLVFCAALVLARAFKKAPAESRHLLWTATFALLLFLPIVIHFVPAWDIQVLPAEQPATEPATILPVPAVSDVSPQFLSRPSVSQTFPVDQSAATPLTVKSVPSDYSLMDWLLGIWAVGCLCILASLCIGTLKFKRLVHQAYEITSAPLLTSFYRIKTRLGIKRTVRFLFSTSISAPLTGGWKVPVILLPAHAEEWTEEQLNIVLTHELVHVRRHDAFRKLISNLAHAVYWFHPLSWLSMWMAEISQEKACDEEVIALGTRPSTYATCILAVAENASPTNLYNTLPMITESQLENRLTSILSANLPGRSIISNLIVLLLIFTLGIAAAIAQPAPRDLPPTPPPVPVRIVPQATPAPTPLVQQGTTASAPLLIAAPAPVKKVHPDAAPARISISPAPSALAKGVLPDNLPPAPNALPQLSTPIQIVPAPPAPPKMECFREGDSGTFKGSLHKTDEIENYSGEFNEDRVIQRVIDGMRVCMRVHGDVLLNNEEKTVQPLGDDSWIVLESEKDELIRLVISEKNGELIHLFTVDGKRKEYNAKAQAWQDRMFDLLDTFYYTSRTKQIEQNLHAQLKQREEYVAQIKQQIAQNMEHMKQLKEKENVEIVRRKSLEESVKLSQIENKELIAEIANLERGIAELKLNKEHAQSDEHKQELILKMKEMEVRKKKVADLMLKNSEKLQKVAQVKLNEQFQQELHQRLRKEMQVIEEKLLNMNVQLKQQDLKKQFPELDTKKEMRDLERDMKKKTEALKKLVEELEDA